jgi:hypothetical protein
MFKTAAIALLAGEAMAAKASWGSCSEVLWEDRVAGKGHAGMKGTFFELASTDVRSWVDDLIRPQWVPACTRH